MEQKTQDEVQRTETETERKPFFDLPSRFDRYEALVEIIATIILGLATLATAWSGYQSARWGGVQAANFNRAGAMRTESVRASNQAGQLVQIDVAIFMNWINAFADEDDALADFYEERFSDRFTPAYSAWIESDPLNNPEAAQSPFALPEYVVGEQVEADRMEKNAEELFALGMDANEISDEYVVNTVILASVLFLAGIQSRFRSIWLRLAIIIVGLIILSIGLYNIIILPIQ
jgi:hypothetical protein